ncbi:hypothetical protein OBBRIDRAFT_792643 [Obba rivulosa]|uniref:FIST domain-containing protein n=1 Tax=Obba rivulosa TaxID=1052685 RepID=A0A8E2AVK1_9APHY|nr:hypothetical protein OBBRIDRAFT_792643 [Obba rivulosa]
MALFARTLLSRSIPAIVSELSSIRDTVPSNPLLFTLSVSPHATSAEYSELVSCLTSLSEYSTGCLSSAIPAPDPAYNDLIACSIAVFDAKTATPFRSDIPGRQTTQVGRWHSFRKRGAIHSDADIQKGGELSSLNWEDIWAQGAEQKTLPTELQSLDPNNVSTVVFLSDNAPEGLSHALQRFPRAAKVGLLASSTPFVTGRPFTLFYGSAVHSSGAVGVCLTSAPAPHMSADFPGLQALTDPLQVTSAEGNLIHSLGGANPSRLLLSAIQKANSATKAELSRMKEDQYYLGVLRGKDSTGGIEQIYHIASGDPSRGSLALDSEAAPGEGAIVQLYHLPAHSRPDVLSRLLQSTAQSTDKHRTMVFAAASADTAFVTSAAATVEGNSDILVLPETFLTVSENGVLVDRLGGDNVTTAAQPWKCTVPGGSISLRWDAFPAAR